MTIKEINEKCCSLALKLKKCRQGKQCKKHHGPLSNTCKAGRLKICKLTGGRKECAKMAALGVLPGQIGELICSPTGSQCLLKIHGGTLSLDQNISDNIIVESI